MTSLWMGDLDGYMDEAFISSAFAAMGEAVVSVKMIKNRATGSPAGYCFVDFGDYTVSQKVMTKLSGLPIPGSNPIKRFKLNWATYGKDSFTQGPEYSIFVGDLSPDVTDNALQEFFQRKFPSCKAAKVVLDTAGNSRGYGFVRFTDEMEHRQAMIDMQGAVGCGSKPLRVSAATPKRPQTSTAASTSAYSSSSAAAAAAAATATANQQYMQQYQQYQQYLAAWQGYQHQQQQQHLQQQHQYYPHYQHYNPYVQTAYHSQMSYEEPTVTVDNTAEDPNPPLNITEENKSIMSSEAEFFYELEQSRWQPVETLSSAAKTVPA